MQAVMLALGWMVGLFIGLAVGIVLAMKAGELLDQPVLETWFYSRAHDAIRVARRIRFWLRRLR